MFNGDISLEMDGVVMLKIVQQWVDRTMPGLGGEVTEVTLVSDEPERYLVRLSPKARS